jgi:membrane-bound metal-dependent hydrolase YbcI (DUF457 family)
LTVYEHVMVGANLALVAGLHGRYGWRITALAALASALPDWDGLSILFGAQAYASAHRVWGHNLLVAVLSGSLVGIIEYRFSPLTSLQHRSGHWVRWPESALPDRPVDGSLFGLIVFTTTGAIASLSHLFVDLFYSGGRQLSAWPLPLLWPFSNRGWTYPCVPWGDMGTTLLFVAEMFVLYRWPSKARLIAGGTLSVVAVYVAVRGRLIAGMP